MVQTRPCHGITFSIYTVTPFENRCTTCCLCLKYSSSPSELLAPPSRSVFTLNVPRAAVWLSWAWGTFALVGACLHRKCFKKYILQLLWYKDEYIDIIHFFLLILKTIKPFSWATPALPHVATVRNVFTSVTSVSRAEPSSWMNEERYTGLQVKNSLTRVHENWIFWKCFNPY